MIKGKIVDLDFNYVIADEALDDYELLDVLCEIDGGNKPLITKAFKLLLGTEQLNALKDAVKKKCGHVSTIEMMSAFSEIMEQTNQIKK